MQHGSGLSGVFVVVVSEPVTYWMKQPSFCSIPIQSYVAVQFVDP